MKRFNCHCQSNFSEIHTHTHQYLNSRGEIAEALLRII